MAVEIKLKILKISLSSVISSKEIPKPVASLISTPKGRILKLNPSFKAAL